MRLASLGATSGAVGPCPGRYKKSQQLDGVGRGFSCPSARGSTCAPAGLRPQRIFLRKILQAAFRFGVLNEDVAVEDLSNNIQGAAPASRCYRRTECGHTYKRREAGAKAEANVNAKASESTHGQA